MNWKRIIFAAVLVPVGVLAFVNVRDYRRYKFITELERHVTPEQFARSPQGGSHVRTV